MDRPVDSVRRVRRVVTIKPGCSCSVPKNWTTFTSVNPLSLKQFYVKKETKRRSGFIHWILAAHALALTRTVPAVFGFMIKPRFSVNVVKVEKSLFLSSQVRVLLGGDD